MPSPSRRSNRIAATSLAAMLALGGTTVVGAAVAGAQTTDPPTTIAPDPVAPITVTATVRIPMIGEITLTVDTSTGEITDVSFVADDGVTATDPVIVERDVQIDVTLADGTTQTIVLETHTRNGEVSIEVEGDHSTDDHDGTDDHGDGVDDEGIDDHVGPPAIEDRGESAEHRQDDQGHRGRGERVDDSTTSTTEPAVGAPTNDSGGRSEGEHRDGSHGDD